MYPKGRAWIELDMRNLASNLKKLEGLVPKDCLLMPAVKANAYGHGAVLVAKTLQNIGIQDFCVNCRPDFDPGLYLSERLSGTVALWSDTDSP